MFWKWIKTGCKERKEEGASGMSRDAEVGEDVFSEVAGVSWGGLDGGV